MSKIYPPEISKELTDIGTELRNKWRASGKGLATFAASCKLSVNSVKAIFRGQTANIANYMMVMRELGLDLSTTTDLIDTKKNSPITEAAPKEGDMAIFS